jgi:hypothetical protein
MFLESARHFWCFESMQFKSENIFEKNIFSSKGPPLVFDDSSQHVSARGRALFAIGLLQKSSLFDP